MKTILTATLLFACIVSGLSQTQETKLVERIMKPNMVLENPLRNKTYEGTSAVPLRASPVTGQAFYGVKDASVKVFSTRSFLGLKNPWFGDKVYSTKDAPAMSVYDVKQAGFNKAANVAGFSGGTNAANLGAPVVPLPTFVPAPAAKGSMSRISDKVTEKMTIEEVRDLLNKNR